MSERKADKQAPAPWQVAVAIKDVAETGQHFDLVADNDVRAAVARVVGLRDLPRLEAIFDVTRQGADGLRVSGRVLATVGQNCVVTLEPLANEVEEDVDLLFAPPPAEVVVVFPGFGAVPGCPGEEPLPGCPPGSDPWP